MALLWMTFRTGTMTPNYKKSIYHTIISTKIQITNEGDSFAKQCMSLGFRWSIGPHWTGEIILQKDVFKLVVERRAWW